MSIIARAHCASVRSSSSGEAATAMPSMSPGLGISPPSSPAIRNGPRPKLPATTCASSCPSTGCG